MTKANFDIPDEDWKAFGRKVFDKYGSQRKAEIVRKLVVAWTEGKINV